MHVLTKEEQNKLSLQDRAVYSTTRKLVEQIESLEAVLDSFVAKCSHPKEFLIKEYKSSYGNYDKTQDCYWINFHCKVCDKRWQEDQ